ncbi:hypothetical protein [Oerskovia jenensis]|uniref:hypothetical protein n=1 Tax=Oerskovia jenensis TaxID=162169 RepID=UPI0036D7FD33
MSALFGRLIGMDLRPGYPEPAVASLLDEWQAASTNSVWLRPGDWYHPAVEALVEALTDARCPAAAAERLGEARGRDGISIGETIDDLSCLFELWGTAPDLRVLRAVSTGWAVGNEVVPGAPPTTDPRSGLVTVPYLVQRLQETYGLADRLGTPAPTTHCLVLVDVAIERIDGWQKVARAAAMGKVLIETFGLGHPVATLGGGIYAALCARTTDLGPLRAELRHRIERTALTFGVTAILRRPPRIWVEPLPARHADAAQMLHDLSR